MKYFKLHWIFGLFINIFLILVISIIIYLSIRSFYEIIIQEVMKNNIEQNFQAAYTALIQSHTVIPIETYKVLKQEYYKNFPNIKIFSSEKIKELLNKDISFKIQDENIKNAFHSGSNLISIDNNKKVIYGYFPIKADSSCRACHNVEKNSILGIISISTDFNSLYNVINKTKIKLAVIAIFSIVIISIIFYFLYIKIIQNKVEKINKYLNKITEGDLSFEIEPDLINRKDILGELSTNISKLQEYLTNFTYKILDFSLKLTKQVDRVYETVDFAQSNVKNLNVSIDSLEIKADNLYKLFNDIFETLNIINSSIKTLESDIIMSPEINIQDNRLQNIMNQFKILYNNISNITNKIENNIKQEEEFFEQINLTKTIITNFNELLTIISRYVYESLIISTYLKNLVYSIKITNIEEKLFDIFETDLDRYSLRIESHLMDIEKLDPVRWSDPLSTALGKWLESDEYKEFKASIKDFDFHEFEKNYNEFLKLGKEIILAYDSDDFINVDNNLKKFRALYLLLKGGITEIKGLYSKFKKEKIS